MAGEIQTSFIPKSPMTATARPATRASVGIMTVIGLILALSAAAIYGGAFSYKIIVEQEVLTIKKNIEDLKATMPKENLQRIERLNTALNNANTLLNNHVSANRIFTVLQQSTIPTVRYTDYSFAGPEVEVKGTARNYREVAAQAEALKKVANLNSFNFSDFTVDPKTKLVNFSLALTFAPAAFKYDAQADSSAAPINITGQATGTATSTIR